MNPGERPVTLIDGREVSNYSEEWRAECEARTVCRMPNRLSRNDYMEKVKSRRGELAFTQLRELVLQVWNSEFRQAG